MKLFYKIKLFFYLVVLIAAIDTRVFAASLEPLQEAIDDVRASIDELATIKDSEDGNISEKESKKVTAGKEALYKIIALGKAEVSALENKLDDLEIEQLVASDFNFDAEETHENLTQMLSYFEAYYDGAVKRVNNLETYEEVRAFARDIRLWRDGVYTPGSQRILSLDLVLKNKNIIKIGNARFDKIAIDLKKLKNAKLITLTAIEPLLNNAAGNKKIAIALDEEITSIMLKMLREYPVVLGGGVKNEPIDIIPDYERVENLVGQSFGNVRDMYKKFLEINSLVKKMLASEK